MDDTIMSEQFHYSMVIQWSEEDQAYLVILTGVGRPSPQLRRGHSRCHLRGGSQARPGGA